MTNKTELLPCPFCGGAAQKIRSSGDERDGYADHVSSICSGCGCRRGAVGDSRKGGYADNSQVEALALAAWNTRAPAEDVRAVVDEPAAYADPKAFDNFKAGIATHEWMWAFADKGLIPLYRHPQRQVLMPERQEEDHFHNVLADRAKGWNACLDEVERLNK